VWYQLKEFIQYKYDTTKDCHYIAKAFWALKERNTDRRFCEQNMIDISFK